MATTAISTQPSSRSVLWGAIGFGLGLGIVSALVGGSDAAFHIPDLNTGLTIGTLAYALAGGFGAAIAFSCARRQAGAYAVAGALGLGIGFFMTTFVHSVYVEPRIRGEITFAIAGVLRFAVIGAWTGLLLGVVQGNRKYVWLVVLAGAIGFPLASVAQTLAMIPLSRISATPNPIANAIGFGAQGAIGGTIGGAFLGAAIWRSRRGGM